MYCYILYILIVESATNAGNGNQMLTNLIARILERTFEKCLNSSDSNLSIKYFCVSAAGLAVGLGIGAIAEVAKQSLGGKQKGGEDILTSLFSVLAVVRYFTNSTD